MSYIKNLEVPSITVEELLEVTEMQQVQLYINDKPYGLFYAYQNFGRDVIKNLKITSQQHVLNQELFITYEDYQQFIQTQYEQQLPESLLYTKYNLYITI
jgi:hypothetical protein